MAVFGLQHMFAMFGATILVPTLTGLSVSATLLFAGLGTLLFHFVSKGKVPAFLGSSFAFIAGYAAIAPNGEADLLPYACLGVACAGLLYLVLSALFKVVRRHAGHAFLSARGHRAHRHLHRAHPGQLGHHERVHELAHRIGGHRHHRHRQHLGQGHGQDHSHPFFAFVLFSFQGAKLLRNFANKTTFCLCKQRGS